MRRVKTPALICIFLALATVAVYWPITHHPFILFDDGQYITLNPHVYLGLSAENFRWAFTSSEAANWHPLTWLSHQLDCTLFGQHAGAHHFVNLLLHVANTLLLFALLRGMTGAMWRSAFVAALFAWHPLHVESVAWAAERKDMLSTLFFLLTLWAYFQFTKSTGADRRNSKIFYLLALIFFICGLMSKPMVVTLPFVLLLLDIWPLRRIQNFENLLLEKTPFFLLAAVGSAVTYLVQTHAGAEWPTPLPERFANAAIAYVSYLGQFFWPQNLAVVYPHPKHWPWLLVACAMLVLTLGTFLAVQARRRLPFITIGWLWFLGTLVPTIGLVQVGAQAMADRYTYIPSIGFFIALVWGVAALGEFKPVLKRMLILFGGGALAGCLVATSIQISYWRNDFSLFRHALEVTTDNYVAANNLGRAYQNIGDVLRSRECFRFAVTSEPRFPHSQFNLAVCQFALGETADGLLHLQAAAALTTHDPEIQFALGGMFAQRSDWKNAANCFSNSILMRTDSAVAHVNYASALANLGRLVPAAAHFREALRIDPEFAEAQKQLARLLAEHPELK